MTTNEQVEIFTDGGCRGNPGVGGWGALLRFRGSEKHLKGAEEYTTNNRMELTAAIEALRSLTRPCKVKLITDSKYVKNGITEWLPGWKKKNWRTASGKEVKNKDLWIALEELIQMHEVEWGWVKGHSGHTENDLVDALANQAMDEFSRS